MVAMQLRFTPMTRRYLAAFAVTASLTLAVTGAIAVGAIAFEGMVFAVVGGRHARRRRQAEQ